MVKGSGKTPLCHACTNLRACSNVVPRAFPFEFEGGKGKSPGNEVEHAGDIR